MKLKRVERELDEWGYEKNRDHNFLKPEGDFATGVALMLAFFFIATVIGFHLGTTL